MSELTLDIDALPAKVPTDPTFAVVTCQQYLARCQRILSEARTAQERESAELWVCNAEGQLERWQAVLTRQSIRH